MQRFKKTAPDVGCGKHSWTHLNPPEAFDSANIQWIQWVLRAYRWRSAVSGSPTLLLSARLRLPSLFFLKTQDFPASLPLCNLKRLIIALSLSPHVQGLSAASQMSLGWMSQAQMSKYN